MLNCIVMEPSVKSEKSGVFERFLRFVCFFVFSTVGMGAIGIALLAGQLANYYADRDIILTHQQRIENLEKLRDQQAELLKNLDNPSVWQRAAVGNYNYDQTQDDPANPTNPPDLPIISDELQKILDKIDQQHPTAQPSRLQRAVETLAAQTTYQILLLVSGAALIILSLTCFTRRK